MLPIRVTLYCDAAAPTHVRVLFESDTDVDILPIGVALHML